MSQAPASQQDDGYTIAVQPICNARMVHVADEILYRLTPGSQSAVIRDATEATARAVNASVTRPPSHPTIQAEPRSADNSFGSHMVHSRLQAERQGA